MLESEVAIDIAGKVCNYTKGDVILLPKGEEHKHRPKVLTEKMQFFAFERIISC